MYYKRAAVNIIHVVDSGSLVKDSVLLTLINKREQIK